MFDILSEVGVRRIPTMSYFFNKDVFSGCLVVGVGPGICDINNSIKTSGVKINYLLDVVYKFNAKNYKLIKKIENKESKGFCVCRKKGSVNYPFVGVVNIKAFGENFSMGNPMLRSGEIELCNSFGCFDKFNSFAEYEDQIPYLPDGKNKDFVYYYPGHEIVVMEQLKYLEKWVQKKLLITENELNYIKKYKTYLDDLVKSWKIYQTSDYDRKTQAMALFEKSAQGK
ncbi:MAG: hypothetical protein JW985_00840 [Alphaproteobacteria bacterium]|nr:hypothetical protein [Alphaproteobacteria bacterium]